MITWDHSKSQLSSYGEQSHPTPIHSDQHDGEEIGMDSLLYSRYLSKLSSYTLPAKPKS